MALGRQGCHDRALSRPAEKRQAPARLLRLRDAAHGIALKEAETDRALENARKPIAQTIPIHARRCQALVEAPDTPFDIARRDGVEPRLAEQRDEPPNFVLCRSLRTMNRCGLQEVVFSVLSECHPPIFTLLVGTRSLSGLTTLYRRTPARLVTDLPTTLVVAPDSLGLQRSSLLRVHVAGSADVADGVRRRLRARGRVDEEAARKLIALLPTP
jgi:hypothetical protein